MKILMLIIILVSTLFAGSYGSLLFHGNCITCHEINRSKSAPSLKEIKKAYLNAFPQKEMFVDYMSTWILNPNAKSSIMQESIEKYELMPQLAYNKEVLEEIAEFIYGTNFEKK